MPEDNAFMRHFLPLRYILGVFFLLAGTSKVLAFTPQAAWLQSFGMPLAAVALGLALIIELLGGLAFLWHVHMRNASVLLLMYMTLVVLIINLSIFNGPFSQVGFGPSDQGLTVWNFLSNLVILGALYGYYRLH